MKPENRPKVLFEGKAYDDYQATQMQRRVEREIRKQKRLKAAYEAAGLDGPAQDASIRLRRLNEKYRAFSKAAGLPEQRERTRVLDIGNGLAKSAESGILKETGGTLYEITEEAIQRVPKVAPEGWNSQQAEALQEAHRDLLRFVKDQPVGTEAGAIYSPDMKLLERRMGAAHEIRMPRYSGEHILIHNHPDGMIFSKRDIESFIGNFDMRVFTAVGNNGAIYLLEKTTQYSAAGFAKLFGPMCAKLSTVKTPNEYADVINRFLEGAEQYGVKFITRR